MSDIYPEIEPYDHGMLDAGGSDRVYWETCGNPRGKPAIALHGGPGSGCTPWHRRLFNPQAYRTVLFDQRGCGRSRPHASAPGTGLADNHTWSLVADIERIREHLGIERWLVFGGSWGSTLALAYAEKHPERVSEIVLWGVTTGRHCEFDWWFRGGASILFPDEWEQLRNALPPENRDGDIVEAYHRMLNHPDPEVRRRAATAWCMWESASPERPADRALTGRFARPEFAMAYARLVTHYVAHNAWIEDGALLRDLDRIAHLRAIMVSGRFDFQAPLGWAWKLHRAWPGSQLVVVNDAGHVMMDKGIAHEIVRATDQFARL